ncbi:hypothetical protein [Paenibacillus rhizoplanae]|uniref:hypothetical protein n=1 Tax=Paenibacillus rhizoplanae TaxID=1917181 RepID=UPI003615E264
MIMMLQLVRRFCQKYLDEDYEQLSCKIGGEFATQVSEQNNYFENKGIDQVTAVRERRHHLVCFLSWTVIASKSTWHLVLIIKSMPIIPSKP